VTTSFQTKAISSVTADSTNERAIASIEASAVPVPLYFPSGAHRVFGWLHVPSGELPPAMGVVICKPFGFESMSAHLSVRAFAEAAADLGIPTLRFDYGGTGDSEDLAPEADQLDAWSQDVIAAVHELQRLTGVERVCLLGFRFGTLLAAIAASRCPQVRAMLAVAPVMSGRRYLRELRNFERAAAQAAHATTAAQMPSRDAELAGAGHLEVSGFFLNAKTVAALQQVDLMALPALSISDALVIDREDLPGASIWKDSLSAAGIRTQYVALPGFVQMMMRAPNLTEIPHEMIAAAREWLRQEQQGARSIASGAVAPRPEASALSSPAVLRLRGDPAATLAEHPVLLRPDPLLFGIVTVPPEGEVRRRGVILLNSGGDHHIGPRRLYVALARKWAKRGYVVLRMDLSGLGDSAAQPGRPVNELFPMGAIDDIRVAVEFMRGQHAVSDVTLLGICSGASHAVRAGMAGVQVNRLLLINPLVFFWQDGVNVNDVQPWEVIHKPAAYLGRALTIEAWRRLLFGDVSIWRVAQIYLHRPMLALQSHIGNLARAVHIHLKNDLGRELKDLKARGVRIVFVFSQGDAGLGLLQLQSGLSVKDLGERYCVRTITGADHEFTRSGPRMALEQVLSEELFARNASAQRSAADPRASLDRSPLPAICVVAPPPKHR
jgi:alpha/beta superfamily hydrolase